MPSEAAFSLVLAAEASLCHSLDSIDKALIGSEIDDNDISTAVSWWLVYIMELYKQVINMIYLACMHIYTYVCTYIYIYTYLTVYAVHIYYT